MDVEGRAPYVHVCEGSRQISISGVKSGIRVAEWFHIMLQPEVRERSVQRVSLVFGGRAIRVQHARESSSAPNQRHTHTHEREEPHQQPLARYRSSDSR